MYYVGVKGINKNVKDDYLDAFFGHNTVLYSEVDLIRKELRSINQDLTKLLSVENVDEEINQKIQELLQKKKDLEDLETNLRQNKEEAYRFEEQPEVISARIERVIPTFTLEEYELGGDLYHVVKALGKPIAYMKVSGEIVRQDENGNEVPTGEFTYVEPDVPIEKVLKGNRSDVYVLYGYCVGVDQDGNAVGFHFPLRVQPALRKLGRVITQNVMGERNDLEYRKLFNFVHRRTPEEALEYVTRVLESNDATLLSEEVLEFFERAKSVLEKIVQLDDQKAKKNEMRILRDEAYITMLEKQREALFEVLKGKGDLRNLFFFKPQGREEYLLRTTVDEYGNPIKKYRYSELIGAKITFLKTIDLENGKVVSVLRPAYLNGEKLPSFEKLLNRLGVIVGAIKLARRVPAQVYRAYVQGLNVKQTMETVKGEGQQISEEEVKGFLSELRRLEAYKKSKLFQSREAPIYSKIDEALKTPLKNRVLLSSSLFALAVEIEKRKEEVLNRFNSALETHLSVEIPKKQKQDYDEAYVMTLARARAVEKFLALEEFKKKVKKEAKVEEVKAREEVKVVEEVKEAKVVEEVQVVEAKQEVATEKSIKKVFVSEEAELSQEVIDVDEEKLLDEVQRIELGR